MGAVEAPPRARGSRGQQLLLVVALAVAVAAKCKPLAPCSNAYQRSKHKSVRLALLMYFNYNYSSTLHTTSITIKHTCHDQTAPLAAPSCP